MRPTRSTPSLLTVVLLLAAAAPAPGTDWPQFLGPERDGRSTDRELVQGWLAAGLRDRWRVPVGEGYSGLAVAAGRVFSMESDGRDEHLLALDASTGEELWRLRNGLSPRDVYGGTGPRVTPTVVADTVYTVTGEGVLLAVRAGDGEVLWERPFLAENDGRGPAEGYAASPLVLGSSILLPVGGADGRSLAAYHRRGGAPVWLAGSDRSSYASPVAARLLGRRQVLFLTASALHGVDPTTGRTLWTYPWPTYDGVNAATPLVLPGDRVFLSAAYDQGSVMLRLEVERGRMVPRELWRNRVMQNHFNNSVHHDGVLYGFDDTILKAVDAESGRQLWAERGLGKGSLIGVGDHLVVLSDDGEVLLARADPEAFEPLARRQVLEGRTWTPPSLAGGRLYLRSRNEAVCLEPDL